MKIRNKAFYEKLKDFIIAALKSLKLESKKVEIPKRLEEKIKWSENGYEIVTKEKFFFKPFLFKCYSKIYSLPEKEALLQEIGRDRSIIACCPNISKENGKPIEKSDLIGGFFFSHFINSFILRFLDEAQALDFQINTFNKLYSDLENFIYTKYDKFQIYVPLINFHSDENKIEFGDGIFIRKLLKRELYYLWEISWGLNSALRNNLNKLKWWICFTVKKEKDTSSVVPNPPSNISTIVEHLITTLRIFKRGLIGTCFIYKLPIGWRRGGFHYSPKDIETLEVPVDISSPFYKGNDYKICKDEARELKSFYKTIKKSFLTMREHVKLGIRRFNIAYERSRPEDKLIDYWITLESLFGDSMGEMTYKVPLRATYFIGKDFNTFKDLKEWYAIRSNIVHGRSVREKKEKQYITKINQNINEFEDLVRKCLVKYIFEDLKTIFKYV